jgi:hypothetical protein
MSDREWSSHPTATGCPVGRSYLHTRCRVLALHPAKQASRGPLSSPCAQQRWVLPRLHRRLPSATDGEHEQVPRSVHISVDDQTASVTSEDALGQGQLGFHRPTGRAGRGAGEEPFGNDKATATPDVLEPSCCRTFPKNWSERLRANLRLHCIPATFRASVTTVSYREASIVVASRRRGFPRRWLRGVPRRLAIRASRRESRWALFLLLGVTGRPLPRHPRVAERSAGRPPRGIKG